MWVHLTKEPQAHELLEIPNGMRCLRQEWRDTHLLLFHLHFVDLRRGAAILESVARVFFELLDLYGSNRAPSMIVDYSA